MKFLPYIFLLCCGLWSTISFADEDYIEYRGISSNNRVTLDPLRLSNKELRWLASKKNLVIAVHKSQTATLLHTDSQQRVRGINADYLNLLKRALNIKLTLREYADHQKAMDALEEGEVDIVLSHLVASPPLNDDIAATKPSDNYLSGAGHHPSRLNATAYLTKTSKYCSSSKLSPRRGNSSIISKSNNYLFYKFISGISIRLSWAQ